MGNSREHILHTYSTEKVSKLALTGARPELLRGSPVDLNSLVLQPNRNVCTAAFCNSGKSPQAVSDINRWKVACICNTEEFIPVSGRWQNIGHRIPGGGEI